MNDKKIRYDNFPEEFRIVIRFVWSLAQNILLTFPSLTINSQTILN